MPCLEFAVLKDFYDFMGLSIMARSEGFKAAAHCSAFYIINLKAEGSSQ